MKAAKASTSFLSLSHSSSLGALFLPSPLALFSASTYDPLAFSASFSFTIMSPGGGLAFVLTTSPALGSGNGHLGIDTSKPSIAVEIDVSKDAWDPDGNHVGVDVNGDPSSIATASPSFSLNDGKKKYAWVEFDGRNALYVFLSDVNSKPGGAPAISTSVSMTAMCDSNKGFNGVYVGFTSEAGGESAEPDSVVVNDFCMSVGE